jgi:hypothetical protein
MKTNFAFLRVLSITLLVAASQFASPAYADRVRDQPDTRDYYVSEPVQRGGYQERRNVRPAPQYAADYQYQQVPQQQSAPPVQPRGRRYLPDEAAPQNQRNNNYAAPNPQYSREDDERAQRERQTERRALLRRQINEARDLYAPVRKQ